jgi:hypothetical protein
MDNSPLVLADKPISVSLRFMSRGVSVCDHQEIQVSGMDYHRLLDVGAFQGVGR